MAKKNTTVTTTEVTYPKIVDTRLDQLHYALEDLKVEALVVTHLPSIRYMTNFSGSTATLFVTENDIHFITDDRYEEQIKTELYNLPNLHTYISRDVWELLKEGKIFHKNASIAFEADRITYADAVQIRNLLRPMKFKPSPKIVERYTMPKSPEELNYIQNACDIAVQVYEGLLDMIKPGVTEREIELEISYQTRKLGSEGDPFPIIVVSGNRGAIVHGRATDKKIKVGDLVLMDFGCTINGFMSDISRTIAVGKASKDQKQLYKLVNNAKEAAIEYVRPAMNGKLVDEVARNMIKKEGFGEFFQHSLGHGIGLEAHEMPTITFRKDDQMVPESCVLAIEPGVYLPDKYGIRVEDCVLVTRSGGKHLTTAPEDLVVI